MPVALHHRRFTAGDQQAFARLSGDVNPIHVDPVAARRTLAGQCIVHGMHSLLWALDALAQARVTAASLNVRFLKPIFLDEDVACNWDDQVGKLVLSVAGTKVVDIGVTVGEARPGDGVAVRSVASRAVPADRTLAESAALVPQPFELHGEASLAADLFPAAVRAYGALAVNELAALSYIVGMEVPGMNSLFSSLQLAFAPAQGQAIAFTVTDADERFNRLSIAVTGHSLQGELQAFQRPAPLRLPAAAELATRVKPGEFAGVNALVVGGSRGLGEITAKLLAAGGGKVFLTYSQGADEAQRIANDITGAGGGCTALPLTIVDAAQLPAGLPRIDQLYFFATPRIFGKRAAAFDEAAYQGFRQVYVTGFEALCRQLSERGGRCAVLYPSTVALERPLPELAEYAKAKAEGEALCARLAADGELSLLVPRLPRTATDQTQALLHAPAADPVDVMLPLIRELTALAHAV